MAARHPSIVDVRGAGLMWASSSTLMPRLWLKQQSSEGSWSTGPVEPWWRLLPPFIITETEIDRAVDILEVTLSEVLEEVTT